MSCSHLQSEYGDIYKVTLVTDGETVTELKVKYFDTLPPCISLCVLKTGFLFAASEFGNHGLYQFIVSGRGRRVGVRVSSGFAVCFAQMPQ
jgi:splicing factor 3B subunit 3